MERVSFFSADYRDGRVRVGNKTYPAGSFAEHLLNQYYKDDTAARIAVFKLDNWVFRTPSLPGFCLSTTSSGQEKKCSIFSTPCPAEAL